MKDPDLHIQECIVGKRSFVLDAGAGAGKTYSLVLALKHACAALGQDMARAGQRIACITFTNVAKDEVIARTGDNPLLRVSTIHDFLWTVVRGHQKPLKKALVKVNEALKPESKRKKDASELARALDAVSITYSDTGSNFLEGRLFHDDLIEVAAVMFQDSPFLSRLVAAQYPYILMDEYQDSSPQVIDILVLGLIAHNPGTVVVGLFGDKLQNIYDSGVGELPAHAAAMLEPVVKGDNRRCSVAVIDLLNRLRTDIKQFPAHKNVAGDAVYIHVAVPDAAAMERVRTFASDTLHWPEGAGTERELYLTHKLIARKGGYEGVLAAFDGRGGFFRDRMLSGEDSRIAFFLDRIEPLATAWEDKKTGLALALLRESGFTLPMTDGKKLTAEAIEKLTTLRHNGDVAAVLKHAQESRLIALPDDLRDRLAGRVPPQSDDLEAAEREKRDAAFYAALFRLPYGEIVAFNAFFRAHTPFATKHGVKGAEFDTVFVVLDDKGARWTTYSFDKYLSREDETKNAGRFRRTRNVFYVCCSRAKVHLAVVDFGATSTEKSAGVKALFGAEKCHEL